MSEPRREPPSNGPKILCSNCGQWTDLSDAVVITDAGRVLFCPHCGHAEAVDDHRSDESGGSGSESVA